MRSIGNKSGGQSRLLPIGNTSKRRHTPLDMCRPPHVWLQSGALQVFYGDGGNRTHVRDRAKVASTSVAGALVSSSARLAGGVAVDQPA